MQAFLSSDTNVKNTALLLKDRHFKSAVNVRNYWRMNILLWKPLFASFVFSTAKCRHGDYPQREGVQRGNKHVFTVYLRRLIFFFNLLCEPFFMLISLTNRKYNTGKDQILQKMDLFVCRFLASHPSSLCTGDRTVTGETGGWTQNASPPAWVVNVPLCSTALLHDWVWWQFPLLFFSSSCARLVSANCSYKGWDGAAQVLALVKVCASRSFISKVSRSQITRAFHSLSGKVSTVREINE